MNFHKTLFFVFTLFPYIFSSEVSIEGAVIIVGSTRAAGLCIPEAAKLFGQSEADFTYATAFSGKRVVSIDVEPCAKEGYEHVRGNFLETTRFASNSQEIVLLEWFPPANKTFYDNPMSKALKKAYELLKPGGRLVIDNYIFFARHSLEDKAEQKVETAIRELNPFALYIGPEEIRAIRSSLEQAVKGTVLESSSVAKTLDFIKRHFNENNEVTATAALALMGDNFKCADLVADAHVHRFLYVYHALSRRDLMVAQLNEMGYKDCKFIFYAVNPYNKRKCAFILEASKPLS
jgi:SAM-dependent methyltransferase